MTIANRITLARIALVPVFMLAMVSKIPYSEILALALFIVASLTDAVDGYVARRMGQVTNFGKFMDPVADKLLVTAAILFFVQFGQMAAVPAILIIAREFLVTSLRTVAVLDGQVIAAGLSGKIKTVIQIFCIAFLLTGQGEIFVVDTLKVGDLVVWFMVLVTLWSGVDYVYKHRHVLKMGS